MSRYGDVRCIPPPLASKSSLVVSFGLPGREPVVASDEFPDGCHPYRGNPQTVTICIKKRFDGVFVHGVISHTNAFDECNDGRLRMHGSYGLGACRLRNERSDMMIALRISLLPDIQDTFGNPKGRDGSFPTVITRMFQNLHPEGHRVMGIVDGRRG